jgi:uncharacterized protein (TIGR02145 family)/uncharacterized repeat protein (TIGR02543 family)
MSPSGGGTVSVNGNNYAGPVSIFSGAQATVTASANSGYTFSGWTTTGGSVAGANSAATSIIVNGNVALTANFTQNPVVPPGGGGDVDYVTIGGKKWMSKNLNVETADSWCYGEGGQVYDSETWELKTLTSSEIQANCNKYGRLYTWSAAMNGASSSSKNPSGVRGICPVGWHLPSDAEWDALVDAVGGWEVAGKKLKSTSGWNWDDDDNVSGNGTDEHVFSALPGGLTGGSGDGIFYNAGIVNFWWTATAIPGSVYAYCPVMSYGHDYVFMDNLEVNFGISVRCVGDGLMFRYD